MLSFDPVPDDERKGRRVGDETKGRIADLASGWTVDGASPPAPEVPIDREPSGRLARNAPRRKAKTVPPPPPGSPQRKALEEGPDAPAEPALLTTPAAPAAPAAPTPPAAKAPPPIPARAKAPSQPPVGKQRARREGQPLDLSTVPEADKTKENRGAVGIKHDKSASLTANAASGTIGETPPPQLDWSDAPDAATTVRSGPNVAPGAVPEPGRRDEVRGTRSAPVVAPPESPEAGRRDQARAARSGPNVAPGESPEAGRRDEVRGTRSAPVVAPPESPESGRRDEVRGTRSAPVVAAGAAEPAVAARGTPSPAITDEPRVEASPPHGLAVPVGEFDHGVTVLEQDKLRIAHAQMTIKRDAANALLGLAEPAATIGKSPARASALRGDPTFNDASSTTTGQFERGDPTDGDERDATTIVPSSRRAPAGTLRSSAALPRTRGVAGDIRYIATVVFGLRTARRELAALEAQQATRQQSRRHHLVTLGRAAVTSESFFHPALGASREKLAVVEDERSQHAGHVVAADAELLRVRRDRDANAKQYVVDLAALDAELAACAKKLEPLEKELAGIKKRASDLHEAVRRIDAKIAATEATLGSVKGGKLDRAEVQAELATHKADRKAIQRDEPVIAGELDAVAPRIAALEAARSEATRKRAELLQSEHDDQRRVEELLTAIGAKRKVVDRAAADAEVLRDKILFQLGEALYVDRPEDLTPELSPIDAIDVELGIADRRVMELREILSSVDRVKVARGVALLTVLVGAIGALTGWLLYTFL